ncbi:MAG: hypothetical protein HFE43_07245 [Oscillospiraceae bacterium]|nr:hypothetical protein [Oscillospiraceae bacterium]
MTIPILIKKARRIFRRYRKLFRLLACLAGAVCLVCYLTAFFSKGIDFLDAFLRRSGKGSAIVYSGQDSHGKITLTVQQQSKDVTTISYQLPYNKLKTYTLTLTEIQRKNPDLPAEYALVIQSGDGSILFDGKYQRGAPFLYSKTGAAVNTDIEPQRNPDNPYLNFAPNLRRMTGIALGEYDQQRGDWFCMLLGAGLLTLIWFDARRLMISGPLEEMLSGTGAFPEAWGHRILLLLRLVAALVGLGLMLAAL